MKEKMEMAVRLLVAAGILLLIAGVIFGFLRQWVFAVLIWVGAFGCLVAALNFKNRKDEKWLPWSAGQLNAGKGQASEGDAMSKYDALWAYIRDGGEEQLTLSFGEIGRIAEVPLDHSFLTYKRELAAFGYEVGKISMKGQTVTFKRIEEK